MLLPILLIIACAGAVLIIISAILAGAMNRMSDATDAFTTALGTLTTDVGALVASNANAAADTASAVQNGVDAFASGATDQINTLDATVKAAIPAS